MNQEVSILLVEDEKKLARAIQRQLERNSFKVDLAFDGVTALERITTQEFHLVILDVNLPLKSGFEVLKELRSRSYMTPVLILSAMDSVNDKVTGLNSGADDYLPKPFDSSELIARINATLRRAGVLRMSVLQASDLAMDLAKRTVTRASKEIALTQTEFALLEFFLRNKNVVLTRQRIAEQVWGYTFDTGTNIVDVYVSYLRDSVDKGFDKRLIDTVRGVGFILRD